LKYFQRLSVVLPRNSPENETRGRKGGLRPFDGYIRQTWFTKRLHLVDTPVKNADSRRESKANALDSSKIQARPIHNKASVARLTPPGAAGRNPEALLGLTARFQDCRLPSLRVPDGVDRGGL
jgi:hypothetical protein